MAISVGVANPGQISGTGNSNGGQYRPVGFDGAYFADVDALRARQNAENASAAGVLANYNAQRNAPQVAAQQAAQQAAQAEAQRINALRGQVNQQQDNYASGANSQARQYQDSYRLQNQGIVNNFRNANDAYNQNRTNTALNTRRSIAGVTSGVRQGLQGAMTGLPDSALDSGATGALARSWNKQGQSEAAGVYNQAAIQNQGFDRDIGRAREDRDQAISNLDRGKGTQVQAIGDQLMTDLRTIDSTASAQGLNGAVNFGLRDNVINNAIARLNALDQERSSALGGINPLDAQQVLAGASALDQAGAQAFNPFTLPDSPGAIAVDEGAPVSQIPFYTRRRDI